ncbi:MAG: dimethyl sulfoxide reductase anchor subunit [Methylibium sp.]|uniref:dimethyl sulfoxide reductase anchor subunit family protein n=1 Tax=Methylibium sp. TaxID=2067992 RepID=UPI00181AE2F3|nr:DmsC/YnfH family molybdoenzyme membrane anchor subunit [Methylibium sp.]MBA3596800.1 dimethyl sulfoxide reductase anchor subunit [Methylibium sp.]
MKPALSIVFFTTLAGSAQGLLVALAVAVLLGQPMSAGFLSAALAVAFVLLMVGLVSSFFHLGRPERAWRSALMWRTSWMSREVIVLPAFIGLVALWWLAVWTETRAASQLLLPVAAIVGAAVLWYCTAMIYACLRFIEEWAHPLTIVNYTLIGLSSGLILTCALAAMFGEANLLAAAAPFALGATLAAWLTRTLALRRNATLKPKSTLQTATGIRSPQLVQKSMGMSAGSYNTREFFHGASAIAVKQAKLALIVLGFAVPAALLLWGLLGGPAFTWVLALLVQAPGLFAERWFFFAQARHPQNLYYQAVS